MRRFVLFLVVLCLFQAPARADGQRPAYLIRLPASIESAFVAETTAAKFHRFDNAQGGRITHRGADYMSIGQYGDGKRYSGDRRTPLGVYFVTEQLDTSRMHQKYGVTAFPIDYPNALDRRLKRTGDGIWVHGVDPAGGKRPPRDTDGCIALPNDRLTALEPRLVANRTPVIIADVVEWAEPHEIEKIGQELDVAVARWADSLERQDAASHLALYDAEFRHWGLDKREWSALRTQNFDTRRVERVTVGELLLLADPLQQDTYLSRFNLSVDERAGSVALTKRLYWRRDERGALRIIAEDSG